MPYLGVTPSTAAGADLDGKELILDADADTTITADTDDTIDIRIAGADDFQFTANTFTAQSGSTIVGHLNATGDTSAGDNAAIGYTAAEGLILTGQGSTNDVTIKNDADADVITVPTGTQNVKIAGPTTIEATGSQTGLTVEGGTLSLASIQLDGGDNANDNSSIQSKYNIHFKADSGEAIAGRTLNFAVGATQGMSIDSSGDVTVSTGNLVIGTSGKGIDFSATADGTTMSSELFDDYEEGTFTPAYTFGGSTTGITYNANGQLGRYTKIGRVVICDIYIGLSSKGSQAGNVRITGLPFTSVAHGLNTSAIVNIGSYTGGWDLSAEAHFTGDVGTGVVTISLRECVFSTDVNPNAVTAAMATDDGQMYLSVTYEAT